MGASLVVSRRFNARSADVYDAMINPDRVSYWWSPKPSWSTVFSNTPTPGGGYRLEMINPDGLSVVVRGSYLQLEPNKRIAFTWQSLVISHSVVLMTLSDETGPTELTLSHDGLHDSEQIQYHLSGWTGCFDQLSSHLIATR